MCLGTIYSWSVFRKPIEALFQISATKSGLPFMVFLAAYAVTMPLAGGFIDRFGPRAVIIAGGALVSAAWIAASFAANITFITLFYGIIGGVGVGVVYGVPLSVSARWYPRRKGLAMGLTLVGFGLSPFITAPLSRVLIENYGVLAAFRILGIIFLFLITVLALPFRFPREDELESYTESHAAGPSASVGEMLRSKEFYGLWICFLIGTFTGLMSIGITSPIAQEFINLDAKTAALFMSLFAIFNGAGRPLFGYLSDKLGIRTAAMMTYAIIIIASVLSLFSGAGKVAFFVASFCMLWMILGGWLAIAPSATMKFFGSKNYNQNYGFVFTAYGVGAILGTLSSGRIKDIFGRYVYVFYITIVLALIGMAISFYSLRKKSL